MTFVASSTSRLIHFHSRGLVCFGLGSVGHASRAEEEDVHCCRCGKGSRRAVPTNLPDNGISILSSWQEHRRILVRCQISSKHTRRIPRSSVLRWRRVTRPLSRIYIAPPPRRVDHDAQSSSTPRPKKRCQIKIFVFQTPIEGFSSLCMLCSNRDWRILLTTLPLDPTAPFLYGGGSYARYD